MKDGGLSTLCRSGRFPREQRVLKIIPGPGYLHSEDGVVWLCNPRLNLYIWVTISSCDGSISLGLGLILRDGGLITLCDSSRSARHQWELRIFPGPGYLHSKYAVIWLWHAMVNLYIWLTISSCYGSIILSFGLIVRDSRLTILCWTCGFACQQSLLKTFPGPGYLHTDDRVVWLWHPLVNLYVWHTISSCYRSIPLALVLIVRDGGLSALCHSCRLDFQ